MSRSGVRISVSFGLGRSPVRGFMLGSLIVHAVFVIALIALPSIFKKNRAFPDDALIVELAPAFPSRSAPPASAPPVRAPEPEPVEQPPPDGARVETQEPPEDPEPLPENPEPAPEREPVEQPPPPSDQQGPAGAAVDDLEGPEAGHGISGLVMGDAEFAWYAASVKSALLSNWRRPILSGLGQELVVSVAFEILRDGRTVNLRIDQPSGVPSLDRSALRAVSDASPLPPLPSGWREPRLEAVYVFRLYPEGF